MFDLHQDGIQSRVIRQFAVGLAVLSLISLLVTTWILVDVGREQEIVARIVQHLPESDSAVAEELSGDLRLDRALTILLVVNVFGTAVAFSLVVRGYLTSERSLRDVKVLATDILASMDAGVITTDRSGMITSGNLTAKKLIGIGEHGMGRTVVEYAPEHALLDTICTEVRTFHAPIRDRDYSVVKNGHKRTLRAGCTLLHNQRKEEIGTVIQVRDVTEQSFTQERLRRMERFMGLGSLAAGLQHEIKNPLSALSIHIQLLCERFSRESLDADVTETLDVLHTEVRRINDVLDGFRNYASVTELGRASVDVTQLVEKLIRLLRPQAEKQHIQINVETSRQMPGLIQADSIRLEQVFLNLALNGMSAMPNGGSLRFRIGLQNDSARIDVIDTGTGIPPEIQSQIFDPYFTTRADGTGMGLALCDKIIRQHNGNIEFQSGPDGTEFTVLLPKGDPQ